MNYVYTAIVSFAAGAFLAWQFRAVVTNEFAAEIARLHDKMNQVRDAVKAKL